MIEKIISGGCTGPERAALDAAIKFGIPHTGWIHHFRSEEREKLLAKYNLSVIPALDPRAAVKRNIMNADGTLILSIGHISENADYARHLTLKSGIQLLGIDLKQYSHIEAGSLIAAWMEMNRVDRLYVTGSETDDGSLAYNLPRRIIESAIVLRLAKPAVQRTRKTGSDAEFRAKKNWPATVPEAVDILISDLFLKDKTRISAMEPLELDELHPTLGLYIKDSFGLLTGNHRLIKSCMQMTRVNEMIPDEAAAVIIKALWKKLQVAHRLRIVP